MNEMFDCSGKYDRFGGQEPDDREFYMDRHDVLAEIASQRLEQIEDLQAEIDSRESELKDLYHQLAELMAG
jgi:hypothetical protein|nr:MAG TPA_asm: protein of unknown function (DUF5320) [Caudoviricetes sp.]